MIEAPLRPLLVVAGAGSGKTETMASRVVWLVANGHVEPDQVLGLTFTRKAATELAERIARRLRRLRHVGLWTPAVEEDGAEVLGGTPDRLHLPLLRRAAGPRARPAPGHRARVAAAVRGRRLAVRGGGGRALRRADGRRRLRRLAPSPPRSSTSPARWPSTCSAPTTSSASSTRSRPASLALPKGASRARDLPKGVKDTLTALRARRAVLPLVRAYLDLKRSRDALDFSDQMALAARLARSFPDIGAAERSRFRAVLLDEFQDTSEAQLVLLQAPLRRRRVSRCR